VELTDDGTTGTRLTSAGNGQFCCPVAHISGGLNHGI
jgi:hypothetical protein